MSTFVVLLIALGYESLFAKLAFKRFVTGMGPCMQDHQALVSEGLIAVLVWALNLLIRVEFAALPLHVEVLFKLLELHTRLSSFIFGFVTNIV